jgi:hypothetical protein
VGPRRGSPLPPRPHSNRTLNKSNILKIFAHLHVVDEAISESRMCPCVCVCVYVACDPTRRPGRPRVMASRLSELITHSRNLQMVAMAIAWYLLYASRPQMPTMRMPICCPMPIVPFPCLALPVAHAHAHVVLMYVCNLTLPSSSIEQRPLNRPMWCLPYIGR